MKEKPSNSAPETENFDVVCLSHLRWNFVYQRPQHLLSRFTESGRVFFFEEPVYSDRPTFLDITERDHNLFVAVPHIAEDDRETADVDEIQRLMLEKLLDTKRVEDFILWFYTPMAMNFAGHLEPQATVFDCMDELSAFRFAPPELIENEKRLLAKADLVFTGGQSLFEAKKDKHERIYAFPSSIDKEHFAKARRIKKEPEDQAGIASPRFGYCGVIDERIDLELLAGLADERPGWQFVMVGPVVKINQDELPQRENIHYLGGKDYKDLPAYLSGWDVALMPFALNESTEFISPTKTPEYLAAGLPVISTPIRDVVRPYGEEELVEIAGTVEEFVAAAEKYLKDEDSFERRKLADDFLSQTSWDKTWKQMNGLIRDALKPTPKAKKQTAM
jgi:glycosyltransferase involved in cell wall biosynthesis